MKYLLRLSIVVMIFSVSILSYSFKKWIILPNNFLYSKEPYGFWTHQKPFSYTAEGFKVKMNASCAEPVYSELEKNVQKDHVSEESTRDYIRFIKNKNQDVLFEPKEVSFPSRFKWLNDEYITYDDPTLRSGIRFTFKIRCLYDKICRLQDSINYLFTKIGVRYFLNEAQAADLTRCIDNEKIYFKTGNHYNFGYSKLHYRYGILYWLKESSTLFAFLVLVIAGLLPFLGIVFYKLSRGKKNET